MTVTVNQSESRNEIKKLVLAKIENPVILENVKLIDRLKDLTYIKPHEKGQLPVSVWVGNFKSSQIAISLKRNF